MLSTVETQVKQNISNYSGPGQLFSLMLFLILKKANVPLTANKNRWNEEKKTGNQNVLARSLGIIIQLSGI